MLGLLRDIRGELADVRAKLDEHDKRFDKIDGKPELVQFQMAHTFGLAGMANLQSQHTGERVGAHEAHQEHLEAAMADLRRRMAEIDKRSEA